jgi:AcrR family transcriptional regulator
MSKDQNKTRALAAMLENDTLTAAAAAAGISRKTLYNYIRDDEAFGAAYRAARDQIAIEQMEALNNGKDRATALLLQLMEDNAQPASIRIKAAQTILTAATRQHEIARGAQMASSIFEGFSL